MQILRVRWRDTAGRVCSNLITVPPGMVFGELIDGVSYDAATGGVCEGCEHYHYHEMLSSGSFMHNGNVPCMGCARYSGMKDRYCSKPAPEVGDVVSDNGVRCVCIEKSSGKQYA